MGYEMLRWHKAKTDEGRVPFYWAICWQGAVPSSPQQACHSASWGHIRAVLHWGSNSRAPGPRHGEVQEPGTPGMSGASKWGGTAHKYSGRGAEWVMVWCTLSIADQCTRPEWGRFGLRSWFHHLTSTLLNLCRLQQGPLKTDLDVNSTTLKRFLGERNNCTNQSILHRVMTKRL